MDASSETAQLCIRGTEREYQHDLDGARSLYAQAWVAAQSDYDRCIAAHYVGHLEPDTTTRLKWHQRALFFADRCPPDQVRSFRGSLYACVARTLVALNRSDEATPFIALAQEHGFDPSGRP